MNLKKFGFGLGLSAGASGTYLVSKKIKEYMKNNYPEYDPTKYAGADSIKIPESVKDMYTHSQKGQMIAGGLTGALATGLAIKKYLNTINKRQHEPKK